MKTITIHSDGFGGKNTAIVTDEGELIDNVIEANIRLTAGEVTEVDLTMQAVSLNVSGVIKEVEFRCPKCEESLQHTCDGFQGSQASGLVPTHFPAPMQPLQPMPMTLAGQVPPIAPVSGPNVSNFSPAGFCNDWIMESNGGRYCCWIPDGVAHQRHVDVRFAMVWRADSITGHVFIDLTKAQ